MRKPDIQKAMEDGTHLAYQYRRSASADERRRVRVVDMTTEDDGYGPKRYYWTIEYLGDATGEPRDPPRRRSYITSASLCMTWDEHLAEMVARKLTAEERQEELRKIARENPFIWAGVRLLNNRAKSTFARSQELKIVERLAKSADDNHYTERRLTVAALRDVLDYMPDHKTVTIRGCWTAEELDEVGRQLTAPETTSVTTTEEA